MSRYLGGRDTERNGEQAESPLHILCLGDQTGNCAQWILCIPFIWTAPRIFQQEHWRPEILWGHFWKLHSALLEWEVISIDLLFPMFPFILGSRLLQVGFVVGKRILYVLGWFPHTISSLLNPALLHQSPFILREELLHMWKPDPCGLEIFITTALEIDSPTGYWIRLNLDLFIVAHISLYTTVRCIENLRGWFWTHTSSQQLPSSQRPHPNIYIFRAVTKEVSQNVLVFIY